MSGLKLKSVNGTTDSAASDFTITVYKAWMEHLKSGMEQIVTGISIHHIDVHRMYRLLHAYARCHDDD